jgi:cyanophycinase
VIPHANTWSHEKARRTFELAPQGCAVVGIDEQTAVVRSPDGTWTASGAGHVAVWIDGQDSPLSALP